MKIHTPLFTIIFSSFLLVACSEKGAESETVEVNSEETQNVVEKVLAETETNTAKATVEATTETTTEATTETASLHTIGAAKLIVDDLVKTQTFYETMFGMKEVRRYDYALDVFEETIMGFENGGATLALFAPNDNVEKPLKKPAAPLVLIYSPEFEAVTKRIEEAGYPIRIFMTKDTGPFNIAIARDPSGNAVEIFGIEEGEYSVGGSKLMVDNREEAEAFYKEILGAQAREYYKTEAYDEVILTYGDGPFHALYQPLNEEPLPKSIFPQTAIYTSDFDNILARLDKRGLGYRHVETQTEGSRIIIAKDTAGNAIEFISRD